ncbi:MAG: hypothetical protein F4X82_02980 [Candidatus Spechtbacteria bacterium SB0662_bin_43]|uniref:Uncharacterized protein n=1 Tax=Candidatus Spechtbacteria bacterium SB0662_bin_43 TaxID=2604897 RepID=A0A845DAM3_9BACT|nr:hypothetical protein [Candidatus Spechtbacteria bacterium SB0662_bin_43]
MNNDTGKHPEDEKSTSTQDHDNDSKKETNPFYSFINNEGDPFLFGLSKVRFFGLCIIIVILIASAVGVSFFRNEIQEQRREKAEQWFVDIGETLCKNQNNEHPFYGPEEIEEACLEGLSTLQQYMGAFQTFVAETGSKGSELSEEELSNVFFKVFVAKEINNRASPGEYAAFMKKCYEHPDINTDTAALLCSLLFFPG